MDGTQATHGCEGMSAPDMGKKHQKEAKTSDIEVQNASILIKLSPILKIGFTLDSNSSKS